MGFTKNASILLLLSLLLIASEEMMAVESRMCASPSINFRGICVWRRNCASTCQSEGYPDGQCMGIRRRCICRTPC